MAALRNFTKLFTSYPIYRDLVFLVQIGKPDAGVNDAPCCWLSPGDTYLYIMRNS